MKILYIKYESALNCFVFYTCTDSHLCSKRSSSDVHLTTQDDQGDFVFLGAPEERDCVKQAVFLITSVCKYSPYQIYCQRIFPGIILVMLTEVRHQGLFFFQEFVIFFLGEYESGGASKTPHFRQDNPNLWVKF